MATDIHLLGSGIRGSLHLTRETVQALNAARRVYVLHNDPAVLDFVRGHCADVQDLIGLYGDQGSRSEVYRDISELLVKDAVENGPGVAFLVHGHPLFLVSATEYTLRRAAESGLRVQMLPGVSSFDTLMCDLGVDYGYALQMYDASTLIAQELTLDPRVPTLVFQLATTLNGAIVRDEPTAEVLAPLVSYLRRWYPAEHPVTVVHSGATAWEPSSKWEVRLGELASSAVDLAYRPTLYVPPVG